MLIEHLELLPDIKIGRVEDLNLSRMLRFDRSKTLKIIKLTYRLERYLFLENKILLFT